MTNPLCFDATRLVSPHLNDSHEAWRKTVRGFVEREITPNVNEWDEAGAFPQELHKKAAAIGLIVQNRKGVTERMTSTGDLATVEARVGIRRGQVTTWI